MSDRPASRARDQIFPQSDAPSGVRASVFRPQQDAPTSGPEAHYQSLFDNAPIGLYRTTLTGQIVDVNPALVKMLGFPDRQSLLKANATELHVDHQDRLREIELLQRDGVLRDFETQLRRYDGTIIWVRDNVRAILDEDGRKMFFLGSLEDVSQRKRADEDVKASLEKLNRAMIGAIEAMAAIAEIRDPYTAGHQRRVAALASGVATALGLEDDRVEAARLAGLVHDIGKIYVPAEILSKPGRLTAIEFSLIRLHSEVGYDILKRIDFPWPLAPIVLQHHERMDGSGYPRGLEGDEILVEARILAVADVVEAMASHRPYRPSLGLDRALQQVSTHAGSLYDEDVVDACLTLFAQGFAFDEHPLASRPPPAPCPKR
jgi:PAS domain S-box-containing protein/putative nucleotidyltransferase with HDIG domain